MPACVFPMRERLSWVRARSGAEVTLGGGARRAPACPPSLPRARPSVVASPRFKRSATAATFVSTRHTPRRLYLPQQVDPVSMARGVTIYFGHLLPWRAHLWPPRRVYVYAEHIQLVLAEVDAVDVYRGLLRHDRIAPTSASRRPARHSCAASFRQQHAPDKRVLFRARFGGEIVGPTPRPAGSPSRERVFLRAMAMRADLAPCRATPAPETVKCAPADREADHQKIDQIGSALLPVRHRRTARILCTSTL